jgi:hypothetical protein
MLNHQAAQRARDMLFGREEIELPPEVTPPILSPGDLSALVSRTQKMVNKREKVRRALHERDQLRTDGTPVNTSAYPAFRHPPEPPY